MEGMDGMDDAFSRKAHKRILAIILCVAVGACSKPVQPETTEATQTLAEAFQQFNSSTKDAENALINSGYFVSDVERAEAYRYLSGMVAMQLRDRLHFNVDTAFPTFHRVVAIGNKWGFSNPDNLYLSASVSDTHSYRITGTLGTANHTIIGSYSGDDESGVAGQRILGRELITESDGRFELLVSRERPQGTRNWIELVPNATSITLYQVFGDWERERKGEYRIEAIGMEGQAMLPLSQKLVAERLVRAGATIHDRILDWLAVAKRIDILPDNSFMPAREIQIASLGSWFEYGNYSIEDDEALIIEVTAPIDARYWGLTLYSWWGETLDYKNRQTSINHTQASIDADGKLRVVLAAKDPGVQNWLDVSGHLRGPINWRVNRLAAPDKFEVTKVKFDELREYLPAETPTFTAQQRRDSIAARQRQIDRRYAE